MMEDVDGLGKENEGSGHRALKMPLFFLRLKRRLLSRHVWLVRLGVVGVGLILTGGVLLALLGILRFFGVDKYFSLAGIFVFEPQGVVESYKGRTNILVLGKAGGENTAPDLTDTMIVVSVGGKESSDVVLISLPRDIWVDDLRAKLNSAYYWGNQKKQGGGLLLAKSAVEEIVGVPIHYGVVIDFSGFKELIDELGGVEVDVERSFFDEKYPIAGRENDECGGDPEYKCRYETIRFEKGVQLMDGETALKFVRSRHSGDLEEGTDIAREQRQQRVISAIEKKLLSRNVLFSPRKMIGVWNSVSGMVETDIGEKGLALLARRAYDARGEMASYTIPEGMLVNPPKSAEYDNLYVFIPNGGSWQEVQDWVGTALTQ
jgi:LCP family protein required for cell wall assembly